MLCDTSAWDESLVMTGLTDHVHLETKVSAYVHAFQSVLKVTGVWIWGESCLVRLNL